MRLVTFRNASGKPVPGVERPDGSIVVIHALVPEAPGTVAGLMGTGASVRERLNAAVAGVNDDPERAYAEQQLVAAGAELLAPLGERVLVVAAGANYRSHLEEMGEEQSDDLAWFVKSPNALIGTGHPIRIPAGFPDKVDFEGELCVVFGEACHDVDPDDALSYVGGYTVMNDVSARDALAGLAMASTPAEGRYAWMNMLLGKQFPTFAPMGPAVVTADEIADPGDLRLTTTVNGVTMQDASTSDLAVGIRELVARLSRYFSFAPGDVLSTGTPSGVGAGRRPPVYLRAGDVVAVEVKGVGALVNPVERPSPTKERG
jgi:2-keto-4-pentenoate hydratase/2-oxohepta-3-ene-1,7-dioic acid hydratase in catechol pathway